MFLSPLFDLGEESHGHVSGVGLGFDLPGEVVAQVLFASSAAAMGIAASAAGVHEQSTARRNAIRRFIPLPIRMPNRRPGLKHRMPQAGGGKRCFGVGAGRRIRLVSLSFTQAVSDMSDIERRHFGVEEEVKILRMHLLNAQAHSVSGMITPPRSSPHRPFGVGAGEATA